MNFFLMFMLLWVEKAFCVGNLASYAPPPGGAPSTLGCSYLPGYTAQLVMRNGQYVCEHTPIQPTAIAAQPQYQTAAGVPNANAQTQPYNQNSSSSSSTSSKNMNLEYNYNQYINLHNVYKKNIENTNRFKNGADPRSWVRAMNAKHFHLKQSHHLHSLMHHQKKIFNKIHGDTKHAVTKFTAHAKHAVAKLKRPDLH